MTWSGSTDRLEVALHGNQAVATKLPASRDSNSRAYR